MNWVKNLANIAKSNKTPDSLIEVSLGVIGRSNVGKSVLFRAMKDMTMKESFKSGLTFFPLNAIDAIDELNESVAEIEEMATGMKSTQNLNEDTLCLLQGSEKRVELRFNEVVGQVLSEPKQFPDLYDQYCDILSEADAIWCMVPSPPSNPNQAEQEQFNRDVVLSQAHLRQALHQRTNPRPCSVAIIVSKVDAFFRKEQQAKKELTSEFLTTTLEQLVSTVCNDKSVKNAAIFPISAFGFGNAKEAGKFAKNEFAKNDRHYVLDRENNKVMEPFNVVPLFLWTMVNGMLHHDLSTNDSPLPTVWDSLQSDFQGMDKLYISLKSALDSEG